MVDENGSWLAPSPKGCQKRRKGVGTQSCLSPAHSPQGEERGLTRPLRPCSDTPPGEMSLLLRSAPEPGFWPTQWEQRDAAWLQGVRGRGPGSPGGAPWSVKCLNTVPPPRDFSAFSPAAVCVRVRTRPPRVTQIQNHCQVQSLCIGKLTTTRKMGCGSREDSAPVPCGLEWPKPQSPSFTVSAPRSASELPLRPQAMGQTAWSVRRWSTGVDVEVSTAQRQARSACLYPLS